MTKIHSVLTVKSIYIMFDETTDKNGRYIFNIVVGNCSAEKREPSYLLRTIELKNKRDQYLSRNN